jgi:hypothetical protein
MTGLKGIIDSKRWIFGVLFVVSCICLLITDHLTDVTFMQITMPVVAVLITAQAYKDVRQSV